MGENEAMAETKLVNRQWEAQVDGEWYPVIGITDDVVVCVGHQYINWRLPDEKLLLLPNDEGVPVRYASPSSKWQPGLWRKGSLTMLAADFGRPDLREAMRGARDIAARLKQ
jgi:hypothetical protein